MKCEHRGFDFFIFSIIDFGNSLTSDINAIENTSTNSFMNTALYPYGTFFNDISGISTFNIFSHVRKISLVRYYRRLLNFSQHLPR